MGDDLKLASNLAPFSRPSDRFVTSGYCEEYVRIPKVSAAPWVDGDLRDGAWKTAARITCSVVAKSGKPAPHVTEVFACHDGEYLYVAWLCYDPDISQLRSEKRSIGNGTDLDDTVRLWIDPKLEHCGETRSFRLDLGLPVTAPVSMVRGVWQMMVNPVGSVWWDIGGDNRCLYNDMYGWDGEARVNKEKGIWSAELRVSFALIGLDLSERNIIGFNPGRSFHGRDIYAWVRPDGDVATGWGFAILETNDETVTEKSKKQVKWLLAKKASLEAGNALDLAPARLRARNKEVGIMPFGPDNRPTLWVGKSDVWDRRFLDNPEKTNVTLEELREAAFSGEDAEMRLVELWKRTSDTHNAYAFPCPKTAGEIIIGLPFDEDTCITTVKVEDAGVGIFDGCDTRVLVKSDAKKAFLLESIEGNKRVHMRIFVHPLENAVVVDGSTENMLGDEIFFRIYRHQDVIRPGQGYKGRWAPTYDYAKESEQTKPLPDPVSGRDADVVWVSQDFAAEKTFPRGFRAVLAGSVSGGTTTGVEVAQMQRNLATKVLAGVGSLGKLDRCYEFWTEWPYVYNAAPGSACTVSIKIAEDGKFRAVFAVSTTRDDRNPRKAAAKLVRKLMARPAEELWEDFSKSVRSNYIPGYDYTGDVPVVQVFDAKFCLNDSPPWHNDFHFNEIGDPQDFAEKFVRGHHDELEPYFQLIEAMIPAAKKYARHVFNCSGAAFPVIHYPIKADMLCQAGLPWDFSMEMTALSIKPFWLHYLYLNDLEFLRKSAYPIMREGACFYAEFLTLGDDWFYHVIPTISPEHWTFFPEFKLNKDSQAALSCIKYHLRATARSARILGVDAKKAKCWEEIAEKLAPYPTYKTPQGEIFVDVVGAPPIKGLNIPVPLTAVFWGDDIGLDSPPEVQAVARRTFDFVIGEERLGFIREVNYQSIARRLGIPRGLGTESLLQSYNGVIRLFPAVPPDFTGAFENLLAVGAFAVSAKMKKGKVAAINVVSNAGNPCRVANPWPGRKVKVIEEKQGRPVASGSGRHIDFKTVAGKTYTLDKVN